jgi:hypothetical protein
MQYNLSKWKRIPTIIFVALVTFILLAFIFFPDELAEFKELVDLSPIEEKPIKTIAPTLPLENFFMLLLAALNLIPVVYYKLCQLTSKTIEEKIEVPLEQNPRLILFFFGKRFFTFYFVGMILLFGKIYFKLTTYNSETSLNPWGVLLVSNMIIGYKCFAAFEKLRKEKFSSIL